jgi:hypothetical protein
MAGVNTVPLACTRRAHMAILASEEIRMGGVVGHLVGVDNSNTGVCQWASCKSAYKPGDIPGELVRHGCGLRRTRFAVLVLYQIFGGESVGWSRLERSRKKLRSCVSRTDTNLQAPEHSRA